MNTKNNIKEVDDTIPVIMVPQNELQQTIDKVKGKKVKIIPVKQEIKEVDAMIQPQDRATIKYLSNVKDPVSGQITQPFNISDKHQDVVPVL